MGACVDGAGVGAMDGAGAAAVGPGVGGAEGAGEGAAEGAGVGAAEGADVGAAVNDTANCFESVSEASGSQVSRTVNSLVSASPKNKVV